MIKTTICGNLVYDPDLKTVLGTMCNQTIRQKLKNW